MIMAGIISKSVYFCSQWRANIRPLLSFTQMTATYTASFTLSSLDAVNTSLSCSSTSPVVSTLTYTTTISSDQLRQGYIIVDSVCLDSSAVYQLSLNHSAPPATPLLVDSVGN